MGNNQVRFQADQWFNIKVCGGSIGSANTFYAPIFNSGGYFRGINQFRIGDGSNEFEGADVCDTCYAAITNECAECGEMFPKDELEDLDGEQYCTECLTGKEDE